MIKYNIHHVKGLYFQITEDEGKNREYEVSFVDRSDNKEIYKTKLNVGGWAQLSRKYLSDIAVFVRFEGRTITQVNFLEQIKGKRVFISFESKALGDTLAWIPYCMEFSKFYECKVIVSTFKNHFFRNKYPELNFSERGEVVNNIIGMFEIGWFWEKEKEPVNPILIPLQKTATNILKLPFKEILPEIDFTPTTRPIEEKYVCISMYSTSQCKLWYYWQDLINFLNDNGYKVIEISKEEEMKSQKTSNFTNLLRITDTSFETTMNYIHHSEFYIGLSSGLSWLAWSLRKKVYMISNFTDKDHEFTINTIRINDETICHSCWHDEKFRFDKGSWTWCPRHEDTPRQFECHKLITAEKVINKIQENEKF
jgi:autotransporter strand-loop-strand O-heptosyltransferase